MPRGYHTSEWAKRENNRTMGRKYNIGSELLHPEDSPRRGEKGRTLNVYTCYDAAGNVMGEGTSRELWEAGVFGDDTGAYYACAEGQKARGEKADCAAKKPERPVLRKIKDPTPLDYDVHDLMTYNAIAKKEGRPELTYGYWAAAGKPARP